MVRQRRLNENKLKLSARKILEEARKAPDSEYVSHQEVRKRVLLRISEKDMEVVRKTFGMLKPKKPLQQLMDEINEGYD